MTDLNLLKKAIAWNEWNTVFYLLDGLLGEYLEGEIESSKDKFNTIWKSLPESKAFEYASNSVFNNISCFTTYVTAYKKKYLVEV